MEVRAICQKDDPWMVRSLPHPDRYNPTTIRFKKKVLENVTFKEKMSGKEAREKGFELDPGTRDTDQLDLEWTEGVIKEIYWQELRLTLNKSCKSRKFRGSTRSELYQASRDPQQLLHYENLSELVNKEIEHWKSNDMSGKNIHPLVLIFLSISDEEEVTVRDIFHITKYNELEMTVTDSQDRVFTIKFEKGMINQGLIRSFILFLPSNICLIDPVNGELLL